MKIENGVPIPPSRQGAGMTASKGYGRGVRSLQPGQSILLPITAKAAQTYMMRARRRIPTARYTSRTVEGGVRIWRLAETTIDDLMS